MKDLIEALNRADELDESIKRSKTLKESSVTHTSDSISTAFESLLSDLEQLNNEFIELEFYPSMDLEDAIEEYEGSSDIMNVQINCPQLGDYPPNYTEVFDVAVLEPGESYFDFDVDAALETVREILGEEDEEYDDYAEALNRAHRMDEEAFSGGNEPSIEEVQSRVPDYLANHPYSKDLDVEDICEEVAANLFDLDYHEMSGDVSYEIFNIVSRYVDSEHEVLDEALVTDYMDSETLHKAMQHLMFGTFNSYNQEENMIVKTTTNHGAFGGVNQSHRYFKFVRGEDGWEAYEVSSTGDKVGDTFLIDNI